MQFPRIVAAPMAGGPTTPALVNAVTFGFLALGTCTPVQAQQWLAQCQAPFGANLFVPQEEPLLDDVSVTAQLLHTDVPTVDVTSGFQEKFSLVLEAAPAVVSSMFGAFTHEQVDQLHAVGAQAWVTVTSVSEAHQALHADGLIVQGSLAGGHRGTWDQRTEPGDASLGELLTQIVPLGLPVIAAGGCGGRRTSISCMRWVRRVWRAGRLSCWRMRLGRASVTGSSCALTRRR